MGGSTTFCSAIRTVGRVAVLCLAPILLFAIAVHPSRARYHHDLLSYVKLQNHGAHLREELSALEAYARRFALEDDFRQRIVKERLGYAASDEFVYIFEE